MLWQIKWKAMLHVYRELNQILGDLWLRSCYSGWKRKGRETVWKKRLSIPSSVMRGHACLNEMSLARLPRIGLSANSQLLYHTFFFLVLWQQRPLSRRLFDKITTRVKHHSAWCTSIQMECRAVASMRLYASVKFNFENARHLQWSAIWSTRLKQLIGPDQLNVRVDQWKISIYWISVCETGPSKNLEYFKK